ncbi:hypothetical protein BC830DRAFT_964138 [Chytriomyces sp. MP71]|nr:hypothetical protein BC830DRAFT_964138 [Chytriomyces sp. MP71]
MSTAAIASSTVSAQQSTSGSDNNTTISVPLVAGIAGGVAVLLLILVLIFCCRKRRVSNEQNHFEDKNNDFNDRDVNTNNAGFFVPAPVVMSPQNTQRRVVYSYRQNLSDELDCIAGDILLVKNEFDDGWAMGFNMRSKTEGYFPLEILEGYGQPNLATVYNKRGSSMYKQASIDDAGVAVNMLSMYSENPAGAAGNIRSVYSEYQTGAASGVTQSVDSEHQTSTVYMSKVESEPRKVLYAYDTTQGDEISLQVGDLVAVQHEYDDGWGYVRNLNSQQEGVIPLDCLAGFDGNEETSGTKKNMRYSHRMSSILGAEMEKAFGSSSASPGLVAPPAVVPKPFASSNSPMHDK